MCIVYHTLERTMEKYDSKKGLYTAQFDVTSCDTTNSHHENDSIIFETIIYDTKDKESNFTIQDFELAFQCPYRLSHR